jgi:glycosyltransferase involved in cell wall biosynthesis
MRILHVPYSFHPDPVGGTEIYVESLAAWQRALGCEVAVAAPASRDAQYEHAGIPVWRFGVAPQLSLREIYGEGDPTAAEGFSRIVDAYRPDVIHLHALTTAVSVLLTDYASRRGISVVFNYHTPTVSCPRGTLLRWGTEICDGALDHATCTACVLQANGIPRVLTSLFQILPSMAGRSGGLWTAVRMSELIELRHRTFHRMMDACGHVVALCQWSRELLMRNRIDPARIIMCRQGINWPEQDFEMGRTRGPVRLPLRLAFLGRLDPTKGVHVVLKALRESPSLPVRLDLYGIRQGDSGNKYAAEMRALAGTDSRIRMLPPLKSADVIPALRTYDALVVPSQWLETGPLVVLEAFAACTPVIGGNLGGIAELVTDGLDGRLISPYNSPQAWAAVLQQVCDEPSTLDSLRARIRPPRHARESAIDLMPLYAAQRIAAGITSGITTA